MTSRSEEEQTLLRQWFIACRSQELLHRPIARTVLNRDLVLFRSGQTLVALSDACPHRNAPLSAGRVVEGCIECPFHGWRFSATGDCVSRPGVPGAMPRALSTDSFPIREQSGYIWVCLDPHVTTAPPVRPWDRDERFDRFHWVDTVQAGFADAIENLLDGTHTPFVHSGLVRSSSHAQALTAIVRVREGLAEAEYLHEGKQSGWISQLLERDRASSFGRFIPPCIAELEYTSKRGPEFVLNTHFTPETPGLLRVYSTIYLRKSRIPFLLKRWMITPFFRRVLQQDQRILRLQHATIERQGGPQFHSWEGDLLRGWIDTWLRTGELPENEAEHRVEFLL